MQRFAEGFAVEPSFRFDLAGIDALRGTQGRAQPIGLRVAAVLEALAAARVGFTREQHLVEPLGLPQAVGSHDQTHTVAASSAARCTVP